MRVGVEFGDEEVMRAENKKSQVKRKRLMQLVNAGRTKKGNVIQKWYHNKLKEDTWICAKCIKNLAYHDKGSAGNVTGILHLGNVTLNVPSDLKCNIISATQIGI